MKPLAPSLSALMFAALAALPAAAEVHKAAKVTCSPERMTRCDAAGKCESREATERDKNQLLVLDFAGKKAIDRREDETNKTEREREIGEISEDKIEGDFRTVVVRRRDAKPEDPPAISAKLHASGKLTGESRRGRQTFEAICKPS